MTPNLRYINQSAPFWDWIASFEQSAADHPFFGGAAAAGPTHQASGSGEERAAHQQPATGPWGGSGAWPNPWARGFGWHGELPHRGGPPPHGAAPPHYHDGANASGAEYSADEKVKDGEAEAEAEGEAEKAGAVPDPAEDAPGCSDRDARRWARREKRNERKGRGCGGGGPFGGRHPHHQHPFGRGGWEGMPGRGGFRMLSELFGPGGHDENANDADWKPEADAFDTESSFVVHVSLPGAHKEDIGVTWDAEKSELTVSGVVHRPGDEAFLKTLALDERKTGAFERKVRLGTRAIPAHIDVEGITAKLENGILIVDVPKLNGEFVEVKKVDIE